MELLRTIFIFCVIETGNLSRLLEANRKILTNATKTFDPALNEGNDISPPMIIRINFPAVGKSWKPDWKLYYRYSYILFDPLSVVLDRHPGVIPISAPSRK